MQPKRVPLRMCAGCGEMKPKAQLVRVVKNKEGEIFIDPTGKKSGRGAYLCPSRECLSKAKKTRRLERSFSCPIEDSVYTALEQAIEKGAESGCK